jgi:hypothetical protein
MSEVKERHGCVTAWLILMIIANSIAFLGNLFLSKGIIEAFENASMPMVLTLSFLGALNIYFAVMLFQWKKMGFYGFVGSSLIGLVLNLVIGIPVVQAIVGLVGVGILFGILQIKAHDGKSAWEGLE